MSECTIERAIVRVCDEQGWYCLKLVNQGARGFPDRTIIGPEFVLFVEVKRPGGRLSKHQQMWISRLKHFGLDVAVVRSLEEFESCLNRIRINKS